MLLSFLLGSIVFLIHWIFAFLPDIPAVPPEFQSYVTFMLSLNNTAGAFLKYLYGETLLQLIAAMLLVLLLMTNLYSTAMWVVRKLPILNIR